MCCYESFGLSVVPIVIVYVVHLFWGQVHQRHGLYESHGDIIVTIFGPGGKFTKVMVAVRARALGGVRTCHPGALVTDQLYMLSPYSLEWRVV